LIQQDQLNTSTNFFIKNVILSDKSDQESFAFHSKNISNKTLHFYWGISYMKTHKDKAENWNYFIFNIPYIP